MRSIQRMLAAWIAVFSGCFIFDASAATDYERELQELESGITAAPIEALAPNGALSQLDVLFRRANLTGFVQHLHAAQKAVESFEKSHGILPELSLIRARLALQLHEPARAQTELAASYIPKESETRRAIEFGVALQTGDYEQARVLCSSATTPGASWEDLARAASLKALFGDLTGADKLYAEAEEELTAKEMRSYAWIRVQRGMLAFRTGDLVQAAAHYARAEKAYSGCWWVQRQQAELLAAQGNSAKAIELYRKLIEANQHPELQQELGDLFTFLGRVSEAKVCYETARQAYLASAGQGESLYIHHLASLLADGFEDGPAALTWARKDMEMRPTHASRDSAAWALYRSGDFEGARVEEERALKYGVVDAHLFFHAAMIYAACLNSKEAAQCFRQVAELNPKYLTTFHAHR